MLKFAHVYLVRCGGAREAFLSASERDAERDRGANTFQQRFVIVEVARKGSTVVRETQ